MRPSLCLCEDVMHGPEYSGFMPRNASLYNMLLHPLLRPLLFLNVLWTLCHSFNFPASLLTVLAADYTKL